MRDILHLALEVERLFRGLPHVFKYGFTALAYTRERTFHFSLHRQKICIQMDDLEALSESILVPKSQNNDCNFIDLIKFLIVAHSEHQFTVMCLTGDSLKSQQLDVLSSRISRAFVLSWSAAVFLIRPLHFLHHFNI